MKKRKETLLTKLTLTNIATDSKLMPVCVQPKLEK